MLGLRRNDQWPLTTSAFFLYPALVTSDVIAELLLPYLGDERLSGTQLDQLSLYLDLLVRWNARTNLTAVREPEHIVSRHFGESLFAARQLLSSGGPSLTNGERQTYCADLGSGAGFPGLPLKIWAPSIHVTLIESQNKKATFLREVIRALSLEGIDVFAGRGEQLASGAPRQKDRGQRFDLVTLRAVERFESALDLAMRLVRPSGHLALLIGASQVDAARNHARHLQWSEADPVPLSASRVLLVGEVLTSHESRQ